MPDLKSRSGPVALTRASHGCEPVSVAATMGFVNQHPDSQDETSRFQTNRQLRTATWVVRTRSTVMTRTQVHSTTTEAGIPTDGESSPLDYPTGTRSPGR